MSGRGSHRVTISASPGSSVPNACVQSVYYDNTRDEPDPSMRRVGINVTSGPFTTMSTVLINILLVCDTPAIELSTTSHTFMEGRSTSVILFPGLRINNTDQHDLAVVNVSVVITTATLDQGNDVLSVGSTGSAAPDSSYNASTGMLTLSGKASVREYESALQSVTFSNSYRGLKTEPRSVEIFVVTNCSAVMEHTPSPTQTVTVEITAVNDAPILHLSGSVRAYQLFQ